MKAIIGHQYKHYKNGKTYLVLGFGYFTETDPLTECVIYQGQYDTPDLGDRPTFIRPRAMFEEAVVSEGGEETARFIDVTDTDTLS